MRRRILVVLALAGCDPLIPVESTDSGTHAIPTAVQDRLSASCAIPGCHNGVSAPDMSPGSTALLDQSSTTGVPFVQFGDIQGSYLALKLLPDPPAGTTMPPPGSPPMAGEDVALVLGWIAGADLSDGMVGGSDGVADGGDGMDGGTGGDGGDGMDGADGADGGDGGSGSDGGDGMDGGSGSDGGGETPVCSLDAVQPGSSFTLDAGDGAGQIPTAVGQVLLDNCGCHYATSATSPFTALLDGPYQPIATLADFTGAYGGVNPGAYGSGSGADAVYDRVVNQGNMPQLVICDVGNGDTITAADLDTLQTWLESGTPDGASGQ